MTLASGIRSKRKIFAVYSKTFYPLYKSLELCGMEVGMTEPGGVSRHCPGLQGYN